MKDKNSRKRDSFLLCLVAVATVWGLVWGWRAVTHSIRLAVQSVFQDQELNPEQPSEAEKTEKI